MEMISAIVYQLTRNLTPEQIREGGFDTYFVDHTTGIYPQFASGTPWSAMTFQSKGDPITDLFEDMAADAAIMQAQSLPLFLIKYVYLICSKQKIWNLFQNFQ